MKQIMFLILCLLWGFEAKSCDTCLGSKESEVFLASPLTPFKTLMEKSMHLMDTQMGKVNLEDKNKERVFLQMMIAHHEGALNMANSLIAHSKDPDLVNYGRSIIANQMNEILYMKALLNKIK